MILILVILHRIKNIVLKVYKFVHNLPNEEPIGNVKKIREHKSRSKQVKLLEYRSVQTF